jgi:CDP-diacylglycerol--serine O-phosphatidyltransferase
MFAYEKIKALATDAAQNASAWERATHFVASYLQPALEFLVPIVALACACLMVSRIRYSHVFNQWFRGRRSYQHILQLVVLFVVGSMVKELAVPLVFCGFAFGAPLRAAWSVIARRKVPDQQPPAAAAQPPGADQPAA